MSGPAITRAANSDDRIAAADFLAQTARIDPAYISHGEIQWGLSPDGRHWAPDLAERLRAEFTGADAPELLLARGPDRIAGIASVSWVEDAPTPHGIVNDLAVDPAARGGGIGGALVAAIEAAARERGIGWLFLESGLKNEGAHGFFERAGFAPVSKVFARRLDD